MRKRCGLLLLVSFATGLTGCAATRMGDGTPTYGPQAWSQAPAPPQRSIASTAPTAQPSPFAEPEQKPVGLARYFPGLQKPQNPQPTKVVARYRPTWFGLRPNPDLARPAQPTTYMTDARAGLTQPLYSSEPTSLPVAIQIPIPASSSDEAVKPANAEQPSDTKPATPSAKPAPSSDSSATIPDFGDTPRIPGESDVNPLPPAIGSVIPTPSGVTNRIPEVPAVDPQPAPKLGTPEAASISLASPSPTAPNDEKAAKAVTPSLPPDLPEPTVPASYTTALVASEAVGFKKLSDCKIFASPQSVPAPAPTPQSSPRPVAKSTPQAVPKAKPVPTSLTKPSAQAAPSAQSPAKPTETTWQRPCLRRLIRRCCQLGEFADPPTAAPH
jgi:hypothetical protein